ncbi:MAG: hypothetical protein QXP78_04020 [Candidatus Bathyarchaeia archaeon]
MNAIEIIEAMYKEKLKPIRIEEVKGLSKDTISLRENTQKY